MERHGGQNSRANQSLQIYTAGNPESDLKAKLAGYELIRSINPAFAGVLCSLGVKHSP